MTSGPHMTSGQWRNLRNGLLFASPWIIGMTIFMVYPIVSSFYYSFCDYSTLRPPVFVGFENYADLFQDHLFYKSLRNTFVFAALSLPAGLATALFLALLLNSNVRGLVIFRTLFYMPCLVPAVASSMLWLWLLNGEYGLLNHALSYVLGPLGLEAPTWLASPLWAKPALALMSVWGVGSTMVIYLAGLQDVPQELYEAAEIDGAGWWCKLWNVTIPSLSAVIYFTLIMGLINVLQIFTPAYIMAGGAAGGTEGNPERSTLFYALYLWAEAFEYLRMGYACAMAWILFIMIVILTLIAHKVAMKKVSYAD